MDVRSKAVKLWSACALLLMLTPIIASAQGQTVRVTGVVRDETNAIALPGVPVEVVDMKLFTPMSTGAMSFRYHRETTSSRSSWTATRSD